MEKNVNKSQMKELVSKLQGLEFEMAGYKFRLKNEKLSDELAGAIEADIDLCEYRYKAETVNLSEEDKDELEKLASKDNITLKFLHTLAFTEEEKEDYFELKRLKAPTKIPGEEEMFKKMEASSNNLKKELKHSRKKFWQK